MPTLLTHIAVPVAAALALGSRRISGGALLAGLLASVLPDFDGISFYVGIPYGGMTGHRGFTHTLAFALLFGMLGAWLAPRWGMRRWVGYLWVMLCTLSHPVLDMMTTGGIGIALLWPWDAHRSFLPWRPIRVSPVTLHGLMSARGVQVAYSELTMVWLPLLAIALGLRWTRHAVRGRA